MADIKCILKELGINHDITESKNGTYVMDIEDMDEFGKYYSLLDRNDDVEELSDNSLMTIHNISLNYLYKTYQISLISDNDQDSYKLVVVPLSEKELKAIEDESDDASEEGEDDEGDTD